MESEHDTLVGCIYKSMLVFHLLKKCDIISVVGIRQRGKM